MSAEDRGAGREPGSVPANAPLKKSAVHPKTTPEDRERAYRCLPHLSCPNPQCPESGKVGSPALRFRGRYGHEPTQLLFGCRGCERRFSLRHDTPFFGLHTPEKTVVDLTRMLGEGVGIRKAGRLLRTKTDTVLRILPHLGEHAQRVVAHLLQGVRPTEVQLDELWSFLKKKEKNVTELEALEEEFGDCWVWVAFDPVNKVVLGLVIGKRKKANAIRLLENLRARLGEGCFPLFTSDELACYEDALVEVYGMEVQPMRQGDRGRFPVSVKIPPEDLLYAVVHKERKDGRVVKVTREVRLGGEARVAAALEKSPVSEKVNTSFVERENGKLRAENSRLVRETLGFSKEKLPFLRSLQLGVAYQHLCRPHKGLRVPLEASSGPRRWEKRTPMMAIGRTDHIWSAEELLLYRVPPGIAAEPFGLAQ